MISDQPSKILIADDNDEYRYILEHTLKNLGHECLLASDGEEAVKITLEVMKIILL